MADRASRERIVAVARAMIETGGLESLSMRKLAAEVGVAPTAIYWHVGSRAELLDAVLDAMIADFPPVVASGRSPRRRLASAARSLRDQVRATTVAHRLADELDRTAELSFPAQVVLTREMQAAVPDGARAAHAVRALLFLVGGFILLEDNFAHRGPGGTTTEELWRTLEDPTIAVPVRAAMSEPADPDALFDFAVDRLLAAVLDEAPAARRGPSPGPPSRRRDV